MAILKVRFGKCMSLPGKQCSLFPKLTLIGLLLRCEALPQVANALFLSFFSLKDNLSLFSLGLYHTPM